MTSASAPSSSNFSFNASLPSSPPMTELFCPLLQTMRSHSLNNDTRVNLTVVGVHGVVSCLGILENALVLWALGFRLRRKTVAAVWVLNLALSDFLATLTLPLFTYYLLTGHSWELGAPLCTAQSSIFFLNMFVSAFLLAAISLDRCLLVARPVWSQNRRNVSAAWKVCALGWLWAAFNTLPYFLFRSVTPKGDGRKLCYHNFALYSSPAALAGDCETRQAATAISKTLLAFALPLVVIAVSYILSGLRLRARQRSKLGLMTSFKGSLRLPRGSVVSSLSAAANAERLSRGFTKMAASVIAAFVLCWAPYHIFCLLEVAAHYWPQILSLVEVGLPMATTIAFLNPVLNPVIYAFSCPHFCTRIRQSLGALCEGLVEEEGPLVLSGSRRSRRRDSPISQTSPTNPVLQLLHRPTLGSLRLPPLRKCPTEAKEEGGDKEGKL